jgi:hypothetical protein
VHKLSAIHEKAMKAPTVHVLAPPPAPAPGKVWHQRVKSALFDFLAVVVYIVNIYAIYKKIRGLHNDALAQYVAHQAEVDAAIGEAIAKAKAAIHPEDPVPDQPAPRPLPTEKGWFASLSPVGISALVVVAMAIGWDGFYLATGGHLGGMGNLGRVVSLALNVTAVGLAVVAAVMYADYMALAVVAVPMVLFAVVEIRALHREHNAEIRRSNSQRIVDKAVESTVIATTSMRDFSKMQSAAAKAVDILKHQGKFLSFVSAGLLTSEHMLTPEEVAEKAGVNLMLTPDEAAGAAGANVGSDE